jgi:hypothetical protein
MSDWTDVTDRIRSNDRFRHRMALGGDEAVRALREDLRLSFPEDERRLLIEDAVRVMESRGERIDSSTRDRGREREQNRQNQLFDPQFPRDYQGGTVQGTFNLPPGGRPPRVEGGSVTNPVRGVPPRSIPFPIQGEEGRHNPTEGFLPQNPRPERHPTLDRALDQALHPVQSIDPNAVSQSVIEQHARLVHGMMTRERLDGLATSIAHVAAQTEGRELILAIILLFTAVGDTLYGHPEHDHALVEERGEWSVLHDYSGVPARFLEARDRIVEAAHEMHTALAPWVGHPMTHENGGQFVQLLVYGSQQARGLLSHLTEHAEHEFNELVTQLSAANDTAAIASAVSTVLEHADRLFHSGDVPLEHTVTTEMAAWLEVGTSTRDANELHAARDQVVAAAHEFAGSLRPYLYRLVDESTRAHLLHPLVHTATQARHHIRHH